MTPIHKPGKPRDHVTSYRPISLLSIPGKVFEKCISDILNSYLSTNKIMINQQFRFRRGHSTIQQIIRITQMVTQQFNTRRCAAMVLLDLSKAFDTVWHGALLYKLNQIGLDPGFIRLIRSYLETRKMFVHLRGSCSREYVVLAGVPQGSILGPYLFNLYINDIPQAFNCLLALFADDTALLFQKNHHFYFLVFKPTWTPF